MKILRTRLYYCVLLALLILVGLAGWLVPVRNVSASEPFPTIELKTQFQAGFPTAMSEGADGHFYVAGSEGPSFFEKTTYVAKLTRSGQLVGKRVFSDGVGNSPWGRPAIDSSGNVFVAVNRHVNEGIAALIAKFGPDGSLLKAEPLPVSDRFLAPFATGVALDSDRGLLYASQDFFNESTGFTNIVVACYDLQLTLVNTVVFNPLNWASSEASISTDSAGSVYVGGFEGRLFPDSERYLALKYSPGLVGSLSFAARQDAVFAEGHTLISDADPNGGMVFFGYEERNGDVLNALRRVSAGGSFQPVIALPFSAALQVAVDKQGNAYVPGFSETTDAASVVKITPTGAFSWSPPLWENDTVASVDAMVIDSANNIYAVGFRLEDDQLYFAKYTQGGCSAGIDPQHKQGDQRWKACRLGYGDWRSRQFTSPDSEPVTQSDAFELVVGSESCSFTLAPGQNNLSGLRDAINGCGLPVRASVRAKKLDDPTRTVYWLAITDIVDGDCTICGGAASQVSLTTVPGGSDIVRADTIGSDGCALTALSMAINFAAKKSNLSGLPDDPKKINDHLIAKGLAPGHERAFDGSGLIFKVAAREVLPKLRFEEKRITCTNTATCLQSGELVDYLDDVLCVKGFPVIVGVNLDIKGDPTHYVLVTGKEGDRYKIADPGFNVDFLDRYPSVETRGFVVDPPDNLSALSVFVNDPADVLLIDPSGNRTGFEPETARRLEEIPRSVHFIDTTRDDETGEDDDGATHSVNLSEPAAGDYRVIVTGLDEEEFTLVMRAYSEDGAAQTPVIIHGRAEPGQTISFRLRYSTSPGSSPEVIACAPTLAAPPDVVVTTGAGATTCDALVSDEALGSPRATAPCSTVTVTRSGVPADNVFFKGVTTITYVATDGFGNQARAIQRVSVVDNTPPTITGASVSASVLWPPNHKMVEVTVGYASTDNCGGPSCSLGVASNEPIDGTGDGDTAPDWEIVDTHRVRLRAERSGTGTGRTYTITITCTDGSGNVATQRLAVTVPHNRK